MTQEHEAISFEAKHAAPLAALRWVLDPPLDGPMNMARDEALLTLVGQGQSPATLRFYRWSPATVSLGYFQSVADFESLPPPAGRLPVVRRTTGGGAILHDRELTYALVLPWSHPLLKRGPNTLYNHVHHAVAGLLAGHGLTVTPGPAASGGCSHRGPFFCFERHSCYDLLLEGQKLMGSAQRRTRWAILQHGSLILERTHSQQASAAVADGTALDIEVHLAALARAIGGDAPSDPEGFTQSEEALASELRAKYADPAWTRKR
jgi:lipoyl(octanoyl) transferase